MKQLGLMNWTDLANYVVQPGDMDLFQTYLMRMILEAIGGSRTNGVIYGGKCTIVSGLTLKISAGFAIFPSGDVVTWADTSVTLAAADATYGRKDRIKIALALQNNTEVVNVDNLTKTLDRIYVATISAVTGVPSATPAAPAYPASDLAVATVLVPANALVLSSLNIDQTPVSAMDISAMFIGDTNHMMRSNYQAGILEFTNDGTTWVPMGGGTSIIRETPTGTIDGVNDTFVLTTAPVSKDALFLTLDGIEVDPADYTLTGKIIQFMPGKLPEPLQVLSAFGLASIGGLVSVGGGGGGSGSGAYTVYGSTATPITVTAAGGISPASDDRQAIFTKSSGGAVSVSANPQIVAGIKVGQELLLIGTSDTDYVSLADGNGLSLNGPISLKNHAGITLIFDGAVWVEYSRR